MTSTTADPALDNRRRHDDTPSARVGAPVGRWSTVADDQRPQGHRAALHRRLAARRCWSSAVLGVLLGFERIDGEARCSTRTRSTSCSPATASVSSSACSCRCSSASPWPSCRCSSAPGRSPSPARGRRVLGLVRRRGAAHRRPVDNGGPGRRQPRHGRPVPRRLRRDAGRAHRQRRDVATIGAHHPGAGHAHARGCRCSPGRRWCAALGLVLVLPVLVGVLIYLYVDYRYTGLLFGGNDGHLVVDRLRLTQPVHAPLRRCRPSASSPSCSRSPSASGCRCVASRSPASAFVGVGLLAGVSPAVGRPGRGPGSDDLADNFGTKLGDVVVVRVVQRCCRCSAC